MPSPKNHTQKQGQSQINRQIETHPIQPSILSINPSKQKNVSKSN